MSGYSYTRDLNFEADLGFRPTPSQYAQITNGTFQLNDLQIPQMQSIPMDLGTPMRSLGMEASNRISADMSAWGRPAGTGVPAQGGFMSRAGNWLSDGQNLGTVFQGLGALTNAYLGFRQLGMAKDQLAFQKGAWQKNFGNSVQTYNTSLEDRIRGRSSNPNESEVQSYLAKHKLKG